MSFLWKHKTQIERATASKNKDKQNRMKFCTKQKQNENEVNRKKGATEGNKKAPLNCSSLAPNYPNRNRDTNS